MNKVLITVNVPILDEEYELFIPVNKKLGVIKEFIIKSISELTGYSLSSNLKLYDALSGISFDNNTYIVSCNIRNGTKLILI